MFCIGLTTLHSCKPAKAMMAIQENFGVIKNWMGDPCNPKAFVWRGLKCSYSAVDPSKITALYVL
jgi:hypothetical protein